PLQWSLYSIISNPYSRRGELYKLFGDAGAAAAGAQGEGFAPQIELVGRHLQTVLLGQIEQDRVKTGLIRLLEGHGQPEPGRQAHEFLPGVALVQVVSGAVAHPLFDKMPPVGGRIDRHIVAAPADAALKDRLERREVVVVGRKTQVVDEKDELERVLRKLVHQGRQLVKLVLLDLDKAQPFGGEFVRNRLDRA